MKTLAVIVASALQIVACAGAFAHGDHKSTHGGDVGRGDDEIVIEFVMEKGTMTLYVADEAGQPLDTTSVTGTLTLISPNRPAREVKLVSAGAHRLAAPGVAPARGDRLRARLALPGGTMVESVALFSH